MEGPKVAIVILNWNGRRYLEQFLPSVTQSTYPQHEVIIADNASTDDSVAFLRSAYPGLRIISLSQNYGFTRGYNEALKQVTAPYYMILNSDVEVSPDWLQPMVTLLESNPTIAACQPKILSWHDRERFEYAGAAGGWIDRYGYPFSKGRVFEYCETDKGQYDQSEPIFWASGAAMFIRSEVYHEHRGFDDFFFAHMEEIDLCWRIQRAGRQIWSCPEAVVYHVGGGTLPKGNPRKTFLNFRNNHIMLWKNLPGISKCWIFPVRILLDLATAGKALLAKDPGTFKAIIRAHWAFLGWLLRAPGPHPTQGSRHTKLSGYFKGNTAWLHFVRKKTKFSEIVRATH